MKVCLVHPPVNPHFGTLDLPLALLLLGAATRETGSVAEVVDFNLLTKYDPHFPLCDSFFDAASSRIGRSRPDLIGISCLSSSLPVALEIAGRCRADHPRAAILLGGPQATLLHHLLLQRCPCVDMVCRGEGEETLRELIARGGDPRGVAGLSWRGAGGEVEVNPERKMMDDLDRSPRPDYSLIDLAAYRRAAPQMGLSIETGRGCPHRCAYCATAKVWGRRFRQKSVGRVLEEVGSSLEQTGIRHVHFVHDLFSWNRPWVRDLCREISDRQLSFAWGCDARLDEVTPGLLREMASAGCRYLFFGMESRSLRMQKEFRKPIHPGRALKILKYALQLGMAPTVAFILGYPSETAEDLEKTVEFLLLLALFHRGVGLVVNAFQPEYATEAYEKHSSDLQLSPFLVHKDLPFQSPALLSRIRQDPELFSHFHFVRNPFYDYAWVEKFYRLLPMVCRCGWLVRFIIGHPKLRLVKFFAELHDFVEPAFRLDEYRRPFYDDRALDRCLRAFRRHLRAQWPGGAEEDGETAAVDLARFLNQKEESGRGAYEADGDRIETAALLA